MRLWAKVFAAICLTAWLTHPAGAIEAIEITSFTPEDYAEIIAGRYREKPARIHGYLSHPQSGTTAPAVIIVPGSGGYAEWMQTTIARPLNDIGIATLIVDSFAGRGVKETSTDQSRVPMSASIMDGFQALQLLAKRSDIDASRIGITGFSRGGVVSMFTAERRLQTAVLPQGLQFAAHLPFYPGCSTQWMNPQPVAAPIMFLLGEKDDMTPAPICIAYAERLRKLGGQISYKVYPGAYHAWTADYAPVKTNAQTFGNCDLQIEDDGQIKDMKSGATTRDGWKTFASKVMQSCGGRGAMAGANHEAREMAIRDMVAFFRQSLLGR